MKKTSLITFLVLFFSFLVFNQIQAALCTDPAATGLVPCGVTLNDRGIPTCPCQIGHVFVAINSVISFIVWDIATPAAVLFLIIGGLLMLVSAGNANLLSLGKQILVSTVIGLVLIFCAWLIVNFILTGLGYTGTWSQIPV